MTMQDAENVKTKLEEAINKKTRNGLKDIEVFIAPSGKHDYESFRKMWRNSTYVVALATYGHADMKVYVCDENFVTNKDDFETMDEFIKRTGIKI